MPTLLVLACLSIIGAALSSPISVKQLQFPFLEGWHLKDLVKTLSPEGRNVSSQPAGRCLDMFLVCTANY